VTDASKYGSLSTGRGTVAVRRTLTDDNRDQQLAVGKSAGGLKVSSPTPPFLSADGSAEGFAVRVRREFRPEGLMCTIEVALPERDDEGNAGPDD
jgi:two-component system CheB/CheR fusion protein